jgi:hypothetical protein
MDCCKWIWPGVPTGTPAMCVVEPVYGAVFDRLIAFVITRPGMVLELMRRRPEGRLALDPLAPLGVAAARAPA